MQHKSTCCLTINSNLAVAISVTCLEEGLGLGVSQSSGRSREILQEQSGEEDHTELRAAFALSSLHFRAMLDFWCCKYLLCSISLAPRPSHCSEDTCFPPCTAGGAPRWSVSNVPTWAHPPRWSHSCPGQWWQRPSWCRPGICQQGPLYQRNPCGWKSQQL